MTCQLDNNTYEYMLQFNKNFYIIYSGGDAYIDNHIYLDKYDNANEVRAHIEDYFKEHNGICQIKETSHN